MLTVMDLNRKKTAILENAYSVSYQKQTNSIWTASFFLPLNDPKVNKVHQLEYVEIRDNPKNGEKEGEYIGLFRVMPSETYVNVEANRIKFDCVSVLSLLMDSVMFRYHEISPNTNTRAVLEYILSLQKVKHWKLGRCDFTRYFQYSWENENGLVDALWSIPKPFDEEYQWTFDTTSYPWTINLIKPPTEPTCRVREGYNLVGFTVEENPNQLINRIYPLGQGEGINQLNIKRVNPTRQYYVEDAASIAKYGLVEYVWVDRRFTVTDHLLNSAKALLKKWKQPIVSWEIDAVDLIKAIPNKPGQRIPKIDELREGKVVRVQTKRYGNLNLRILKESKSDMFGNPQDLQLVIGYVPSDLGTTQADVERNIQINELYSQGATNILNYDKADNCDPKYPVKFRIFIDDDVVKINTCELTFETSAFRAYSKAIKGGGSIVTSTKGGGATVSSGTTAGGGATVNSGTTAGGGAYVQGSSTQSGGGNTVGSTSQSGGGSTQSSSNNGSHKHIMFRNGRNPGTGPIGPVQYTDGIGTSVIVDVAGSYYTELETAEAAQNHSHSVNIPSHTHNFSVSIPSHSHNFSINIPNHSHSFSFTLSDHTHQFSFTLPDHTHEIELPDHTHEIEYGIFEDSSYPKAVTIEVDGSTISGTATYRERFNLVDHLSKNQDGTIQRGWHEIVMTPDKLARIEAQITMRVFIKSQLGGEF